MTGKAPRAGSGRSGGGLDRGRHATAPGSPGARFAMGRPAHGGGRRAAAAEVTGAPSLPELLDLVWARIEAGVADASAPARTPALATLGEGGPEIRTLVLRAADRGAGTLDLHADAASAKVAQLRADPRAALHVWDAGASLQLRLRARVEVLTGEGADAAWARVPEAARANYGGAPAPGQPLARPEALEPRAERARFAVLRCRAKEVEALLLADPHRRAVYARADGFAGGWVAP